MATRTKSIVLFLVGSFMLMVPLTTQAQSILGSWQLVSSSDCIEEQLDKPASEEASLVNEMKQMSSPSPQVIRFGEKGSGEESTRILNKKKSANSKAFLYKVNGENLMILDKRSQTISEIYNIDTLTADSLIISNSSRSCDIRIFVKIKDRK